MKINRFWIMQILIIATLFAALIGSYLFSFGWFGTKTSTVKPAQPVAEQSAAAVAAVEPPATCSAAGETPSLTSIADSLGSNDPARQQRCIAFLQAESRAGDKGAELWLGRAYHNGWGVAKSAEEAAIHYRNAANTDEADTRDSALQWLRQLQQESPQQQP